MKNDFEIYGDIAVIFLKKRGGLVIEAIIDAEDIPKVSQICGSWTPRKTNYNTHYVETITKDSREQLHRFIMDARKGYVVDHINHNPLDNRKSNLRVVTHKQNMQNRFGAQTNSKSGIRGVSWHSQSKKWQSAVTLEGKLHFIGLYDDIEEAEKVVKNFRAHTMPYSKEAQNLEVDTSLFPTKGGVYKTNKSGVRGVSFDKETNKWRASISIKNKRTNLGRFYTIEEAVNAVNIFRRNKVKHEYEVINTITKDDIARVGDANIFVEESCGILKAMVEEDGKDITNYLLTCTTLEETFDYVTYKVYAELRNII